MKKLIDLVQKQPLFALWTICITAIAFAWLIERAQPPPRDTLRSLVHLETYFVEPQSHHLIPIRHTCGGIVISSDARYARGGPQQTRAYILTAAHCVGDAKTTQVTWRGGLLGAPVEMEGRIIAAEWETEKLSDRIIIRKDLALVEVYGTQKLPAVRILFDPPVAGESVFLVGYPLDEPASISQGFMSAGVNAMGFMVSSPTALMGDSGGGLFVLRWSCMCYKLAGIIDAVPRVYISPKDTVPASKLTYTFPMDDVRRFLREAGVL